ncbi:DUF2202 domain-containing protein [Actinomycetes bacterium KLBMP 9797]
MNRTTHRVAVAIAAGVLGLGGLAVAMPAVAGAIPFTGRPAATATPGWPGGMGHGSGGGMMGSGGAAWGGCAGPAVTAPQGTLTTAQKTTQAAQAQEEKLAHDLYAAFAAKYPSAVFDRIAFAETRHLAAVRTLMSRYGVTDPTAGLAAGTFSDPAVQRTYDRLLARGLGSQGAALEVGQEVERTDIADLEAALKGLTAPDVTQLYTHLLMSSQHHLIAFTS